MDYRTKGVCSQSIHFDIEDNKIHNVSFVGGCNGNLQGISHLVEGMDVDEAISRLEGIQCGFTKTHVYGHHLQTHYLCSGTERSNRKIVEKWQTNREGSLLLIQSFPSALLVHGLINSRFW